MKRLIIGIACLLTMSAGAVELHWLSSGMNERDLTISPDGRLLMTTIMSPSNHFAVIMMSRFDDGKWQDLDVAPFSGRYSDIEPMFSPDGKRLYFASKRPKPPRDGDDWDIWYVEVDETEFSAPINAGENINTEGNEFYPSISESGALYFTAEREGGVGGEDIYVASSDDDGFKEAKLVPGNVNSKAYEFNAFVAADESYIIFTAQGRSNEMGRGDLYISFAGNEGSFGEPVMLPEPFNSNMLDYCPSVVGNDFYFTSRRFTDVDGVSSYDDVRQVFESPLNGMGDIYRGALEDLLKLAQ